MSSPTKTKECLLNQVTKQLSKLLTNDDSYPSAFRIHNKQLTILGDLSFQTNLNFAAWKQLKLNSSKTCENIFDYASELHNKTINEDSISQIIDENNDLNIKLNKCCVIKTNCHVFLDRQFVTERILNEIISDNEYGCYKLKPGLKVTVENTNEHVSELRVKILHGIIMNFINFDTNMQKDAKEIFLITKSSDNHDKKILCGCVVNEKGQKEELLTSTDIYDEYASNMRMMFEHKYGVRKISEKPNWKQKIDKLGHAAVTFQMIQNTPQKTISLASKHHVIKDAAFVIYNGARISSILRRFESEIEKNTHNKLPTIENIDFSTLRLSEEWDLIYAFLAQFPDVIKKCVCDLPEGKLNFQKLYEFLVHFSTAFSVYYSRIKIITEAKEHLLPTMHARIYLLKSIERVLQNALKLLNIELVNQM